MNQRTKKAKKNKQKNVGKSRQQSTKYWMAMGTMSALLACAPDYADAATPTREMIAPTVLDAIYRQDRAQARTTQRFDIPPGSLDSVLNAFQNLTKWRVLTPNEFIRSLPSPGVSGVSTVEQALKQILAGTGIVYRFTGEETVTLDLEKITGSVDVIDRVEGITSPKFTEPLRNTPQSVAVVSRQVMEDQGTMTLRDSLRNVAGISLAAGEGGAQGDNLTIRGFTARNDIFNDGMRDFGSYYRDPFNLEEVEVLKGPSSVSFGRGTTGGVVNQASKTPQSKGFISGSVNFGSDQTRRGSLDINEPLPKLGTGTAFRLNLMGNDSKVAGRDIAENRRYGIAPSLAFGLDSHTRLTLSYFHLSADDIPDYGIPWLFNGPANVPRNNYYGFKDANFLDTDADIGTARLEHDFNESISLRNQWRYARYNREAQITEARLAGTVTPTTPLSAINVTRNQIAVDSVETFLQNQTDLTARFRTGFIRHTVVAGIEVGRETSDPTRFTFTGVPVTSLLRPDTNQIFSGTSTASSRVNTIATSVAAYLLDTLKLGEKWELIGGVRWDRFDADYSQSVAPASAFHRVDNMTSWRGAVVYKPLEQGSVYFDYGTSFNPSAESLSLSAGTANAAPEKNTTYELGSKWDLYTKKLSLRASLFRTEKTNARETDPTNALLVVLSGNQRVSGFEAEVTGLLTDRWQMLASYALLDNELVSSKFFPAAIGSRLANVPRNTFSLWTNYRSPLWKLSFGGGGQFVDSRSASSTAPLDPATGLVKEVPSYWVFNGVVKRPLTERIDVQLNAYNLTNRYYYDQLHPAHIVPGPGRSVLLGVNFKF
jgi:catecholate siderophore receptor